MAWLKVDTTTPEKPEVLGITVALGWDDPDLVVGKLIRAWRWFDQHTIDGNAPSVTCALLDRIIGVSGFSEAMQSVGWLIVTDTGLLLPKFDEHNGKTAKDRAQTAARVAKHKNKPPTNDPVTVDALADALPREREEVIHTHTALPRDWALPKAWGLWAIGESPHWTEDVVRSVADQFRDHCHAKATSSADWKASWQLWCRDELTQRAHPPPKPKPAERAAADKPATVPSNAHAETAAYLAERAAIEGCPPPAHLRERLAAKKSSEGAQA